MERILKKRGILELYLNVAEWGDYGIFGVATAAQHYYGKPPSELTAEESARLAAILPNPRKYNPLGESGYVLQRANLIYSIMVRRGIVVPEYDEVVEEDVAVPEIEPRGIGELRESPVQMTPEEGVSRAE